MKLYWRYKKDGKWTWTPAVVCQGQNRPKKEAGRVKYTVYFYEEEEE